LFSPHSMATRASYTYTNENLEAPVILNGAGATVGIASYTVGGAGPMIGPFTAVTTARGDWSKSLCGTAWLRNIVDRSTVNPLSAPLLYCP